MIPSWLGKFEFVVRRLMKESPKVILQLEVSNTALLVIGLLLPPSSYNMDYLSIYFPKLPSTDYLDT